MAARQHEVSTDQEAGDRGKWVLPASTAAVAPARGHARRWLTDAGAPTPVRDAAVLVVSELVTNAIQASPAPDNTIRLQLTRTAAGWRITVADRGHGFILPLSLVPEPGTLPVGGRGLAVVASVAGAISVRRHPGGWTAVSTVVPAATGDENITSEGSGQSGQ
jgi:anti-sigma regulatory factor (Ser/Thr protein kinase)